MYKKYLQSGIEAVKNSMRIVSLIQKELTSDDSLSKKDKSPVTIADFVSQSIICTALQDECPDINIVAEEDSSQLRDNKDLIDKIFYFINKANLYDIIENNDDLFKGIDYGKSTPDKRFFTLDPIDGTKGFLRGDQYAVALAFIEEYDVKFGILGCPNIDKESGGTIYYGVKREGAYKISKGETKKIRVSDNKNYELMRFVQSFERSHSDSDLQYIISKELGIRAEPVKVDSQVKYGLLAEGKAEIYLRIPNPKTPNYKEKIWDHAAGSVIVEEAGGIVLDMFGNKLDFSRGIKLEGNKGILATTPFLIEKILNIIKSHF